MNSADAIERRKMIPSRIRIGRNRSCLSQRVRGDFADAVATLGDAIIDPRSSSGRTTSRCFSNSDHRLMRRLAVQARQREFRMQLISHHHLADETASLQII